MEAIPERLYALQDAGYQAFQTKLIPTVPPDTVLGVRMPALRVLAKELRGTVRAECFLQTLPHRYYEEYALHALLLEQERDYGVALQQVERLLPWVDNWAICDLLHPKCFSRHLPELLEPIRRWLASGQTYTVRFGIGMLLRHYLDEAFRPEYPELVAGLCSDEYYVNMMLAWYFATALAKQWPVALPFLEQRRLSPWVHQKTIQKAVESYRIPDAHKAYLRSLRLGK